MGGRKTLALVSLGCAKNAVDLQVRAGMMIDRGYVLSADPDRADVVVVNTCSFIAAAREETEAEIVRAIELKRRGNFGKVVVCGCYPERYPGAAELFPGVDEWVGVPKKWEENPVAGMRFTGKAFAYLKIAEGCVHRCAYCAIPSIRGKYRSRPVGSILAEARALLGTGCRELNVIAQDPMLYGIDFPGRKKDRMNLTDLLWALDELPGEFWVRVLYSYPSEITGEFLDWMRSSRHAVRYIDVPLQHTVPEVLERMNRAEAADASLAAADVLREMVPGVTLRTTIMTGFPGETESRFKRLLCDLRRMQFDHLGAFAYSPEKGTSSYSMSSRPSRAVAEKREGEVMALAKKIYQVKARRMLGKEFDALVVAPGVARMASQAPEVDGVVHVDGGEVGSFIRIKLLKAKGFDFIGEMV